MRIVTLAALVAAGMLGVFLAREKQHSATLVADLQNFEKSAKSLESELARTRAERDELRQQHGTPPTAATPPVMPAPRVSPKPEPASSGDFVRMLEERAAELVESRKARDELEAQVRQLESRIQALTQETERLAAAEKQLREQSEAAARKAASLEGELKARDERLQKTELSLRELRQQTSDRGRRSAALDKISEEFEDLNRRRDVYIGIMLRRYREVTDLYRTLSLRQEGPRDELSRIQNAINMAEEDMRQLQALNAQARKLQKELDAPRK